LIFDEKTEISENIEDFQFLKHFYKKKTIAQFEYFITYNFVEYY